MYIFGSASNLKCTEYSDTDIAIDFEDEKLMNSFSRHYTNICKMCENGCDILYMNEIDYHEGIFMRILKGVRIL